MEQMLSFLTEESQQAAAASAVSLPLRVQQGALPHTCCPLQLGSSSGLTDCQ